MNNPIDVLMHEHTVINRIGHSSKKMNKLWESKPEEYRSKLVKVVDFLHEYADKYHHRKEEDVLFPLIFNHPDFSLHEMIDEFEGHHDAFRDDLQSILDELRTNNFEQSYAILQSYLQDIQDHIAAENDELFVLAESLLSENELETTYFRFKDIDMELGEDRKEELEKFAL